MPSAIPTPQAAHREVGRAAAGAGVDLLLAYGGDACYYSQGAKEGGVESETFSDKADLLARLRGALGPGDIVWVKGSRGMRMEEVLQGLYKGERIDE